MVVSSTHTGHLIIGPYTMMTSSNGNFFSVTGHLCAEFTGLRLGLGLGLGLSKQWWGWWFETLSGPLWRHCNALGLLHWLWDNRMTTRVPGKYPRRMGVNLVDTWPIQNTIILGIYCMQLSKSYTSLLFLSAQLYYAGVVHNSWQWCIHKLSIL